MKRGDYVFGISPASTRPRRILFATRIEQPMTFEEAYTRFPDLRGPSGPIHVKPIEGNGFGKTFPENKYAHIPGANHECSDWRKDIANRSRDVFFVCCQGKDWFGRWLGEYGPEIDQSNLGFLDSCFLQPRKELRYNADATIDNPIRSGRGNIGLHLETDNPERLVKLCEDFVRANPPNFEQVRRNMPTRPL
jgi:hypothetical protein